MTTEPAPQPVETTKKTKRRKMPAPEEVKQTDGGFELIFTESRATLKSLQVLRAYTEGEEGEAAFDLLLSLDIQPDGEAALPATVAVDALVAESERIIEGKSAAKLTVKRNYAISSWTIFDSIRQAHVMANAEVKGATSLSVVKGVALLRLKLAISVSAADLVALSWLIGNNCNVTTMPIQQSLA